MTEMTIPQVLQLLKDSHKKGSRPITLVTETEVKLLKSAPPEYDGTLKLAKINGLLNNNYEKAINKKLSKMGETPDFEAGDRKWGERVGDTCIIEHKGESYVEVNVQKTIDCVYKNRNKPVLPKLIQQYFPARKPSILKWRTYNIKNVKYLKLDGQLIHVTV